MNAQDNWDAVPIVQGDERCDSDTADRRALHQNKGVLQHARLQDQGSSGARTATKTISWNEWNPFERATGQALKQLNRRQRKPGFDDAEDAPF
jgi:hypothetical protein